MYLPPCLPIISPELYELAQVLFDAPADDVAEARVILVDALNHAWSSSRMRETSDLRRSAHCSALASPRAKMLAT
jgi:hypothetical protein